VATPEEKSDTTVSFFYPLPSINPLIPAYHMRFHFITYIFTLSRQAPPCQEAKRRAHLFFIYLLFAFYPVSLLFFTSFDHILMT
jgi:hypothetical protein